ncbi:MAG TPA: universal stress protein [Blastocatellia bacterium]|nr:universal stress protein [Blastocatellia bacterium]
MKILLAVDGSEFSDAAVREVTDRPWPVFSVIRVISAVEMPVVPATEPWALPASYFWEWERSEKAKAHDAVDRAVARLREGLEMTIEVTTVIREGHVEEVILDEAEKWGADLIVLGSHGYRGFRRFLLGSTSQAVASHAKCSVEIVRTPECAGKQAFPHYR